MNKYDRLLSSARALVIFKELLRDDVVFSLLNALRCDGTNEKVFLKYYSDLVYALYKNTDDLNEYINNLLQDCESFYVKQSAKGQVSPFIQETLERELDFFEELSQITSAEFKSIYNGIDLPQWKNGNIAIKEEYKKKIASIKTTGYGMYAKHRMFLYKDEKIIPVKYPDPQRLSQMSGYELERQKVIDNTMALLQGKPCNNVLLYGDAGSGKSSTIKAIVNEYWEMGLRLIEIKKNQLYSLPDVIEQLADNPLKFIIFIDDLSFSTNDSDFGALKAILEGGVAGKTDNLVIYATSNRRNLVKENFSDRNGDDVHLQDTIQEVMSLSARFGLKVTFSRPNKDLYLSIVENLFYAV